MRIYKRFEHGIYDVAIGRNPDLFDLATLTLPTSGSHGAVNAVNRVTGKEEPVGYYTSISKLPGSNDRFFAGYRDLERPEDPKQVEQLRTE